MDNQLNTIGKSVKRIDRDRKRARGEGALAKINYRRLSDPVCKRHPFRAAMGERENSAHTFSFPSPAAYRRAGLPKTNSRPFFCSVPRIYPGVSPSVEECVFRAAKKAPGGGSRLVSSLSGRRTEAGYRDEVRWDETEKGWTEGG